MCSSVKPPSAMLNMNFSGEPGLGGTMAAGFTTTDSFCLFSTVSSPGFSFVGFVVSTAGVCECECGVFVLGLFLGFEFVASFTASFSFSAVSFSGFFSPSSFAASK